MDQSVAVPGLVAAPKTPVRRLGEFLATYATIGAVCESSRWLARRMEKAIDQPTLPIVELGAGYGSLTRVLPETAISIERDETRFRYLKENFPERTILDSCAIEVLGQLKQPTVIISSIPSVNNPEFGGLRASVVRAQKAGKVAQLIVYTYFPINPFAGIFPKSEMVGLELLNVPPAFVWRYSC